MRRESIVQIFGLAVAAGSVVVLIVGILHSI
ncbi:hypothetical protein BH20ACT10_BH20ACT10_14410 [soil metagenome]|jgi:hypothetical protein